MPIRPTQASLFGLVRAGLLDNASRSATIQAQISSGRRILRPSDDPVGSSLAASLRRQLARSERFSGAIDAARSLLDNSAAAIQGASELVSEAREAILQGLNGTQSPADRRLLAARIGGIREQLLDIANQQLGGRYLFAGTETGTQPFRADGGGPVSYEGDDGVLELQVGVGSNVRANLPGSEVFARRGPGTTLYSGLTGVARGARADSGSGSAYLELRHDATTGSLGGGLAFVAAGAGDTLLGDHALTVDAAAGTARLDGGPAVAIPAAGDPQLASLVLTSEAGATLALDFTGWTGVDVAASVRGEGSISLDGATFTPLDFVAADLRLTDAAGDTVLHVDTTGIHRAGVELVTFGGTGNLFDVLAGFVEDLENVHGLDASEVVERMGQRLPELDRNAQNLVQALGTLGTRSAGVSRTQERLADADVHVQGLLSSIEDVDFSEAVLDMAAAQQALQTTQATGARLLQTSLLDFLR